MSAAERPARPPRARRVRRQRTASESLLSIVLVLESLVMLFATLVVFGLGVLDPEVALPLGTALVIALVVTARTLRWSAGVWVGWLLQVLIIASGFLVTSMFIIGTLFVALWVWCWYTGGRLDARNRARAAESANDMTATGIPATDPKDPS